MSSRSDDVPVHIVPPPTKRRRIHTHNSSRSTRDSRTTQIVTLSTGSSGRLRQRRTHKTSALRVVDPDREIEAWTSSAHDNTSGENVEQPSDDNAQKVDKPKGAARTAKLTEYISLRDSFLDELLRHDGHGDSLHSAACYSCETEKPAFKCLDCFCQRMRCRTCITNAHRDSPLHRIQEWNGAFFDKVSTRNLGIRYQLGHGGGRCSLPLAGPSDFCLFDTSGVHFVAFDFCDCGHQGHEFERWQQLMRARWFPASFSRPKTAFSFDLLETFHELTLQGKTTQYDYYHCILRRYDNSKLHKSVHKYAEFTDAVRIWRNLMLLKRGGRGQDPSGAAGTQEGELAIRCPACPRPGENLPDDWENAPPEVRWKYTLFKSYDACFKLGLKDRGLQDVELAPGWAYYVEESRYQHHIKTHPNASELSTCTSNHDAILRANTRHKDGYLASGQGLGLCARHALVDANGVGDLQLGEQYRNMDFIILSSLIGFCLLRVIVTYDIACQWSRNFGSRMREYPPSMQLDLEKVELRPAVPDFHIRAHGTDCQETFSLAFLQHSGRTIGEEVETGWAHMGLASSSIQEMRPANRRETLDDHWGGWNYQKTLTFRKLFRKRFKIAYKARGVHQQLFEELTQTFKPETIARWERHAVDWDADEHVPNPFEEPISRTTERDMRVMLAKEDELEATQGNIPPHKMTPAAFIAQGLDIEEVQRALRLHITLSGQLTRTQQIAVHERRVSLMRQIAAWRDAQMVYMPCVASLLVSLSPPDFEAPISRSRSASECAENIPLWLPSSLLDSLPLSLRTTGLIPGLYEKEKRLRLAQADDALAEIRRLRRIVTGLVIFKKLNVSGTGQKKNTRIRTLFMRFGNTTKKVAERYRAAFRALEKLDRDGDWTSRLRVLRDEDIRGPGREERDDKFDNRPGASERRREPSWIWLVPRVATEGDMEEHLDANLRVEWMKSRARSYRWGEEVGLIPEEMRRTLVSFEVRAAWWRRRKHLRAGIDPSTAHGVNAYAEKQACLLERRVTQYSTCWLPFLASYGVIPSWSEKYVNRAQEGSGPWVNAENDEEDEEMEDDNDDDLVGSFNARPLRRVVDEYELDF